MSLPRLSVDVVQNELTIKEKTYPIDHMDALVLDVLLDAKLPLWQSEMCEREPRLKVIKRMGRFISGLQRRLPKLAKVLKKSGKGFWLDRDGLNEVE